MHDLPRQAFIVSDAEAPQRAGGWLPRVRLLGVAGIVFVLDQYTKAAVVRAMFVGETAPLLGSSVSLTRRSNTGGAFGMFPGSSAVLALVGAAVIVALVLLAPRFTGLNKAALVGLALVMGGAAGNLVDRVRGGHVVDFIDVHFWPVFNVADIGITVGAILVLIALLLEGKSR